MTTGNDARHPRDASTDANRPSRLNIHRATHMVVGSLVGFEDEPRGGMFPSDGPHRRRQHRRVIPADSEEHRTRRVWGDDNVVTVVIVVVERRRKELIHFSHGVCLDDSRRPPPGRVAVTEHFVCPVARSPGRRGQRTNDPSAVLVFPENPGRSDLPDRLLFRDDSTHCLPV